MSTRVSPLERVRADIDDLFASERDLGEVLEEVARLGVRLLMQTAIEAEVTEFLGRERYAHGERARPGSRNGHCPTTVKTTTGPVTHRAAQAAGHRRGVRVAAVGCGRVPHQRVGVPRHRRLRAGPVGARRRSHPGRRARRRGDAVEVDGEPGLRGDQGPSSTPGSSRDLLRRHPRVPVPGRLATSDARRRPGRAGAGGVGDDHRGPAAAGGPGGRLVGVDRRLGRVPRTASSPGACGPRCWSSPTAPPASSPPSSSSSPTACASAA